LSYGIYVFAYPLGMIVALTGLAEWGVGGIIGGTIALVLPLAWMSWALIESRALRLRGWSPTAGRGVSAVVSPRAMLRDLMS
jgi:peptidoglycan/LPS O-acetylase OafA/YrhL